MQSARDILRNGYISHSAESTFGLAAALAKELSKGDFIALYGDLGAGKTTFVKGLASGLGICETVKSPSFNICSYYENAPLSLVHVDAYRLSSAADFENLLIDEIFPFPKVVCVEWPQAVVEAVPPNALSVEINSMPDGKRFLKLR